MKTEKLNIFRRIAVLIFILITSLSLVFIYLTYLATTNFFQAGTQLLNKDVAAHIAKFTSPFGTAGIDKNKADSVFYNAMVISPSAEVYFLDTTGKVIAFHSPESEIRLWSISLKNIERHIASGGKDYIKGPDPKDPGNPKIFSAAEVNGEARKLGYIYVILGSSEFNSINEMLYRSQIVRLAAEAFCIIVPMSLLISLLYINRLQKRFRRMIGVLEKFQAGDFEARFHSTDNDELAPVTQAFNRMADQLVYHINLLKKSEKERKDFIAAISHDLRTPLSIARGYTETMLLKNDQHTLTSGEREQFLTLVLNKTQQVELMVNQLFELSKMDSADFRPDKQPFIFSEILYEVVNASRIAATNRNVKIDCRDCEDNSWIRADIAMMERVVQNLLTNAIKYTPAEKQVRITLNRSGNELIFRIENEGEPLPGELIAWINAKPDDENVSINRPANSGLGLAIVRKILFLHGFPFEALAPNGHVNVFLFRMQVSM